MQLRTDKDLLQGAWQSLRTFIPSQFEVILRCSDGDTVWCLIRCVWHCVRLCEVVRVCAWLYNSVSLYVWVGVHLWVIIRVRFVTNVSVINVCARRSVSWPGLHIIHMRVRHWLYYPSIWMAPSHASPNLTIQFNGVVERGVQRKSKLTPW